MELVVLDKPTEYYAYLLFNCQDEEVRIYCFQNAIDYINKARKLVMCLRYKGYDFKKLDAKKEMETRNGDKIKDVLIFVLEMCDSVKKSKKELDKDKEIKLIKKSEYKEMGRMIFLKKHILYGLGKKRMDEKEDYNNVIERLLEDG